jgi:hypothetical protein
MKKAAFWGSVVLWAAIGLACAFADLQDGPADDGSIPRMSMYFNQAQGEEGMHFSSQLYGANAYGGQSVTWGLRSLRIVAGYLPSGLTLAWDTIRGTPTQPGRWQVTFQYEIEARRSGMSEIQTGSFTTTFSIDEYWGW